MLQKHKILSLKENTNHVKRLLDNNEFEKNIDYLVTQVGHQVLSGTKYKNVYHLTPNCFKLCAMRSQNIKIYAHYYLLIEMSMAYFSKYQIKIEKKYNIEYKEIISEQKNIISQKDDKLNELQDQITILLKNSQDQIKKSDEILNNNRDSDIKYNTIIEKLDNITEELVDTKEELVDTKEELEDTNNNVRLIAKQLDIAVTDRVSRPFIKSLYFFTIYILIQFFLN